MPPEDPLVIRSFRSVFEIERRIYRVDRLRLNPGGIPVRGLAYLMAALAAMAAASALPVSGWALSVLPWYIRLVGLPLAGAFLLGIVRVDGRPFHLAAGSLARLAWTPRRLSAFRPSPPAHARWTPGPMVLLPDGSDGRLRRMRYHGPGAVLVAVSHLRSDSPRGSKVSLHAARNPRPIRPRAMLLAAGGRLEVRPARAPRTR